MKELTTIKGDKWIWPAYDVTSWDGQNEYQNLVDYILPHLKNNNVMVQAGGNCGFMLSKFVEHFKIIYTFEPDPVNFYCLNQNITSQNVIKMQCCLGSTNNPVKIQQLIRPGVPNDIGGVHVSGEGYIPSITIDGLNLPDCDLIQLDVEGFELHALLGALDTIKKYKPLLCVEFYEEWLSRYDSSCKKVEDLLHSLEYEHIATCGADRIYINRSN